MAEDSEITYSSQDILGDSVAGQKGNYFVKIKKDKKPLLKKIREFITGSKKRTIIVGVVIVAILLIIIMTLVLLKTGAFESATSSPSDDEPIGGEEYRISLENPQEVEAELKAYDEKIEQAGTPEQASELYGERGMYLWDALAFSGDQDYLDQILTDLKKAEELVPSARTAYDLCLFFEVYENLNVDKIDYCTMVRERDPDFVRKINAEDGEG